MRDVRQIQLAIETALSIRDDDDKGDIGYCHISSNTRKRT